MSHAPRCRQQCQVVTPLSAVLNTTFVGARLTAARLHRGSTPFLTTLSRFQKNSKKHTLAVAQSSFRIRTPD
jgi:hypothetical protein